MLDRTLSQLVLAIAPRHTAAARAPETFGAITQAHGQRNDVLVWDGASESTIWGDARVNHAFRAWHDLHHITGWHDFTLAGELDTMRAQQAHLIAAHGDNAFTRRACAILECEIAGQARHYATYGEFPIDQLQFAKDYLA